MFVVFVQRLTLTDNFTFFFLMFSPFSGLRTLCFAFREISSEEYEVLYRKPYLCFSCDILENKQLTYLTLRDSSVNLILNIHCVCVSFQEWSATYYKASTALQNREKKLEEAAELVEMNFTLIGASAIEDKLQDVRPPSHQLYSVLSPDPYCSASQGECCMGFKQMSSNLLEVWELVAVVSLK